MKKILYCVMLIMILTASRAVAQSSLEPPETKTSVSLGMSPDISIERSDPEIHIFPNPVTITLFIKQNEEEEWVTITDIIGKILYSKEAHGKEESISVKDFPNGFYFVRVGNHKVQKIRKD